MIREIQLKDKKQWEKPYRGYADFYKAEMNIFLKNKLEYYKLDNHLPKSRRYTKK